MRHPWRAALALVRSAKLSAVSPFSRLLRITIAVMALGGVAALLVYGTYTWQREKNETHTNLGILSGFLATATQSWFDNLGNNLEPLGLLLDQRGVLTQPETARPILKQFMARYPEIGAMAVVTPQGATLINTAAAPGEPLPDFRADPAFLAKFQAALADPALYTVGPPEYGKVIKQWRFPFRHVVRDTRGAPRFVLQAAIPLESGRTFLQRLPLPAHSFIGLLREDGYQQARWPVSDPAAIYSQPLRGPLQQAIDANPQQRAGVFAGKSLWTGGNSERVGAYTQLSTNALYAYVSVPAAHVWDRWWLQNGPVLAMFAVFIVVSVALAWRVAMRERSHSRELLDLARRDSLTGLPNRAAAKEILDRLLGVADSAGQPLAVLFLDLDRFKDINDTLGHDVGDALLTASTAQIRSALRGADVLARFGGDEFLILLPGADRVGATITTQRILAAFQAPLSVRGHTLAVTPSVGIAVYPKHGHDAETLVRHADTAMYEAKRQGRNAYMMYAEQLGERLNARTGLERELREALQREEFRLVYQPIIDVASQRIVGAEALVRWVRPDGSLRSPAEFIPVAEESGLILPLGEWVLHTACVQARAWRQQGHDLWMAVNLSARQFQDPLLLPKVEAALSHGAGCRLELEVTESAAMRDPQASIALLSQLRARGVRIALDDFGTGYSSLGYLKRIPSHKIKIDRSFIDGLNREPDATAIVHTIVALANALGLETLAEGIETEAQFHAIRALGCHQAQGYWISRPVPAADFVRLLAERAAA
jgi:diguanylate cyclase (GGDEF)-like protein